jgi:hypothetical protein
MFSNRFRGAITDIKALGGTRHWIRSQLINFEVKLRVKTGNNILRKEKWGIFFKIESGNKNMLQKLISLKYWKIWMMKIELTIILMKNGKTLKQ